MATATLPLAIPASRQITLGGERLRSDRFTAELQTQSLADVRAMVQQITQEVIAQQAAAGNPPTLREVDGRTDKPLADVNAKTETVFGDVLPQSAMREIEAALAAAIEASTRARTGRLRDVAGAWQWVYLPSGGAPRVVTSASTLTFSRGDRLVLVPQQVPYATIANRNVAQSGRLNARPRKGKEPPKSRQNRGFLFHAAEKVRRRTAFKLFNVKVVFSKQHMVPGEVMTEKSGTGMIQITARTRRVVR